MKGVHFIGDWQNCPHPTPEFLEVQALRAACLKAVEVSGLTALGDCFHQFEPYGVTGTVILEESHLAIHTWPELGGVTLDVYVCNYTEDNTAKAKKLYDYLFNIFKPKTKHFQMIERGGSDDDPAF
jgi:S-adenosylmethionine decarboxylase proenzyme